MTDDQEPIETSYRVTAENGRPVKQPIIASWWNLIMLAIFLGVAFMFRLMMNGTHH